MFLRIDPDANASNNNVIIQANAISDGLMGTVGKDEAQRQKVLSGTPQNAHLCVLGCGFFFSGTGFFWLLCVCKRISQSLL